MRWLLLLILLLLFAWAVIQPASDERAFDLHQALERKEEL